MTRNHFPHKSLCLVTRKMEVNRLIESATIAGPSHKIKNHSIKFSNVLINGKSIKLLGFQSFVKYLCPEIFIQMHVNFDFGLSFPRLTGNKKSGKERRESGNDSRRNHPESRRTDGIPGQPSYELVFFGSK